jgi:hypothetical protein
MSRTSWPWLPNLKNGIAVVLRTEDVSQFKLFDHGEGVRDGRMPPGLRRRSSFAWRFIIQRFVLPRATSIVVRNVDLGFRLARQQDVTKTGPSEEDRRGEKCFRLSIVKFRQSNSDDSKCSDRQNCGQDFSALSPRPILMW